MKYFAGFLMILIVVACSSNQPQPIKYGMEDCADCKMTIADENFGAEVITTKGKVYKFDDINCMIAYIKNQHIEDSEISQKLVIDFNRKNNFIDVTSAVYFVGEEVHSPMRSNAAAFPNREEALSFQNGKTGYITEWNDLYKKFN